MKKNILQIAVATATVAMLVVPSVSFAANSKAIAKNPAVVQCKKTAGEAEFKAAVKVANDAYKTAIKTAKTKDERKTAVKARNEAMKAARDARSAAKKACETTATTTSTTSANQ